jgi:hypothetical protein
MLGVEVDFCKARQLPQCSTFPPTLPVSSSSGISLQHQSVEADAPCRLCYIYPPLRRSLGTKSLAPLVFTPLGSK